MVWTSFTRIPETLEKSSANKPEHFTIPKLSRGNASQEEICEDQVFEFFVPTILQTDEVSEIIEKVAVIKLEKKSMTAE